MRKSVALVGVLLLFFSVALLPRIESSGFDETGIAACAVEYPVATEDGSLRIECGGESVLYIDRRIEPTDFTVQEEIEKRRINDTRERKFLLVDECLRRSMSMKDALTVCFPLLKNSVDELCRRVYMPPTDSQLLFDSQSETFTATEAVVGRRIDERTLYRDIYLALKANRPSVRAVAVAVAPKITRAQSLLATTERSHFSTDFSYSGDNRKHNINLALSMIDGVRIDSGARFSFNECVGARTEERGFKQAKIIVGGKYVDGTGGGVCQVSTTLYNAALIAGLRCEANSHSIAPSYVSPSFDAMVNSCSSDLVIYNDTNAPIFISSKSVDGKAVVKIFGLQNEYKIKREWKIVETLDAEDVELVDEGRKYFPIGTAAGTKLRVTYPIYGKKSEGYLVYYSGDEFVKRELLRTDTYYPSNGITYIAP